jgi:hypothetical protein
MRKYINLFEAQSDLATALDHLDDYINNNTPVDHHAIAAALRRSGYVEPMWGTKFFRALNHPVKAGNESSTVEDYFAMFKAQPAMRLEGAESFCDNLEDALQFVSGTIHLAHYQDKWVEHQPHHVVDSIVGLWVVYEVTAPAASVLWSTKGLRIMAQSQPEIAARIAGILEEYGYQNEICIDTKSARIVDLHLYDSEDDEDEYN